MKEGKKVKTLILEDVKDLKTSLLDFDGNVDVIAIVPSTGYDLSALIEQLNDFKLYKVVAKPDLNLQKLGIELDYHAVDPIIITDGIFTDPEFIIFNGDIKIPRKPVENITVVGGYFMDEEVAKELCREINVHMSKRVDKIVEVLAESQKLRRDIANNAMS